MDKWLKSIWYAVGIIALLVALMLFLCTVGGQLPAASGVGLVIGSLSSALTSFTFARLLELRE